MGSLDCKAILASFALCKTLVTAALILVDLSFIELLKDSLSRPGFPRLGQTFKVSFDFELNSPNSLKKYHHFRPDPIQLVVPSLQDTPELTWLGAIFLTPKFAMNRFRGSFTHRPSKYPRIRGTLNSVKRKGEF